MNSQGRAPIRFTLNGQRYELAREDVEARLSDVPPDVIRKHAVRINDTWYPAIQAFEVATGVPRSEFISHTARRHLAALGFTVQVAKNEAHLCCGSEGTYSVLNPELSYQLRDRKLGHLGELQPAVIASANIGCITHLQSGTATPVRHWIELLDEALQP